MKLFKATYSEKTNILVIRCHHMTFKKWWKEVTESELTMSIAKYLKEPYKTLGSYCIIPFEGSGDALKTIVELRCPDAKRI